MCAQCTVRSPPALAADFSVGLDALIALKFHRKREAAPKLFTGRLINRMWYGHMGVKTLLERSPAGTKELAKLVRVFADGEPLDLGSLEALVVLNLQSYAGGKDLWGSDPGNVAIDDGKLELVGFSSTVHAGRVQAYLGSATRVKQASHIRIEWLTPHPLACQVDGEPWEQAASAVEVSFSHRSSVLHRRGEKAAHYSQPPLQK